MSIIARLGVVLGINTAEFTKGLDDATKKTREFERNQKQALKDAKKSQEEFMAFAAKGLAGVTAAALALGKAFQYADQIADTAEAYDVTIESLIALQAAMQGSGGEALNVGTSLQKLASAQQSAIDGSNEMRESFEKLNISGKDVENLKLADFYKRVVQELAKVEDTTQRAALQQELLGKAMKGVDVRTFVDKYKEMGDPALVAAIKENAKAWDNIEAAFKSILYFAQKAVAPFAAIVNSISDIAKGINSFSNLGMPAATEFGATSYGLSSEVSTGGNQISLAPAAGDYSTQTDKDKNKEKKDADEAKRRQEARQSLQLEIKLIKEKSDIADKMFAVDSKGIVLGQAAISQEKMLLDLANDLAEIRSAAAKERNKEKAEVDLINQKEAAAIAARVQAFGIANGLRQQGIQREHELTMNNISIEQEKQTAVNDAAFDAISGLLNLENKKFEIGENAYELQKLSVEKQNELAKAAAQDSNARIDILETYKLSAKSAEDLALKEEKFRLLDLNYEKEKIRISEVHKTRSEILSQQQQRDHVIALASIKNQAYEQEVIARQETDHTIELVNLEKQKFDLGSAAYAQKKLEIEAVQAVKKIQLETKIQINELNNAYELTAKTIEDTVLFEANKKKILDNQLLVIDSIVRTEEARKEATKEQFELQDKMFKLDLARQKGRDIANIQSTLNTEKQRLQLESNRYLMSTNQYNLSNLALENIHRLIEAEKKYNDQMKEAEYEMQRQGGGQEAREEYEQRIKTIEEVRDIELDAIDQINNARQRNLEKEIDRQRNFVDGWHYAAKQFQENSENAFKRGEAAFSSVMSSMDAAISNFVETGKFKFEDFALGIIKDLIRMEMQAQASMLFRSLVGMFSPAGIKTMNYDAGVSSIPMAASGGYIDSPTIVGENGAELFVPNTPGTVIPNGSWQQAAASMGGSGFTNNGTYIASMSAIDTQSATQFLASNKNTIWAAYQSANRSVPISR